VIIFFISLSTGSLLLGAAAPETRAAGPAGLYREKCALCHDAGATGAPRLDRPAEWTQRAAKGYAGLLRSALLGVPGTAMLPKAGFPELTEAELAGAVRYMMARVGLPPDLAPAAQATVQPAAPSFEARVDDAALSLAAAQALLLAKVGGVQVEARGGKVVLKGVVDDAAAAARAKRAVQGVAGVREIEDRLVSADVFEHD
jgi:cytochrome c5